MRSGSFRGGSCRRRGARRPASCAPGGGEGARRRRGVQVSCSLHLLRRNRDVSWGRHSKPPVPRSPRRTLPPGEAPPGAGDGAPARARRVPGSPRRRGPAAPKPLSGTGVRRIVPGALELLEGAPASYPEKGKERRALFPPSAAPPRGLVPSSFREGCAPERPSPALQVPASPQARRPKLRAGALGSSRSGCSPAGRDRLASETGAGHLTAANSSGLRAVTFHPSIRQESWTSLPARGWGGVGCVKTPLLRGERLALGCALQRREAGKEMITKLKEELGFHRKARTDGSEIVSPSAFLLPEAESRGWRLRSASGSGRMAPLAPSFFQSSLRSQRSLLAGSRPPARPRAPSRRVPEPGGRGRLAEALGAAGGAAT
ncbi:unnamed protein product [Rangifer tarandus platyrhynchus]|uniref:Uncharacterized protein n=1 Tax=Rangifer tarandus platyrhynchus TaxID=3082113 RepID=A0ABN8YTX6_RANTA|nr:unnamed protein product [Rangifer tarandus platyrhynchus]